MASDPKFPRSLPSPTRPAPPPKPPSALASFGTVLTTAALAVGGAMLAAHMFDLHKHTCDGCGHSWRHLGAFNVGDPISHTCKQCGVVQWWKDGVPHVFRSSLQPLQAMTPGAMGRLQEIREVPRQTLTSGLSAFGAGLPVTKENKP